MTDIPFVTVEQLKIAADMVSFILELPEDVIICAGVRVQPSAEEIGSDSPNYRVTVGCPYALDTKTCASAVSMTLRKKWKYETIDVTAFHCRTRQLTSAS